MTPAGLVALRRTAALVHAVPGLSARLRHEGATLVEVARPDGTEPAAGRRHLSPCAFRVAVGRALDATRRGRAISVLGLTPGCDPAIDVAARRGAMLLPGGIVEIPAAGAIELAFVTTLAADEVCELHEHDDEVRAHPDPVLATTLVIHRAAAHPSTDSLARVLTRTHELLARCAVAEFIDHKGGYVQRLSPIDPHQ
jgi:hypothetical protein